ncbi:Mitochondrial distribution and morphology protein-like protein [Hapsidospora chrysogenum ATCC 11550]|uniref:Mitochondrial distribution and morphology protein 12 n=1 Tax=Hapsidospora chrysogenum (strain ATCC 11550 / CBS 779.69 / DSM 880 / IAM 14645 / JCM 23072 / IMI 49137) TaxID=857340 RepID=A0A086T1V6_HAPC1|nr:Mitochondrial distribution and morphology protein-like protein [Hapsidospora chrysogenum ATCC 11550]
MSIDLNWETLTTGPDGDALAERIRSFIHDKFQTVPLPRFIKSVTVHGFHFGAIPPRLDLKDITDPLPDFYEAELDDDEDEEEDEIRGGAGEQQQQQQQQQHAAAEAGQPGVAERRGERRPLGLRSEMLSRSEMSGNDLGSPFLGTSTPGILGGPGLNYFQSHLERTGTHTPLAAVAGAHLGNNATWRGSTPDPEARTPSHSHSRNPSHGSISLDNFGLPPQSLREKSSVSTLAPTSVSTSRPPTRDDAHFESAIVEEDNDDDDDDDGTRRHQSHREPRVEDVQAVFRIRYAGDVRLNLTAEILLDYPMPSFVGIPLKLNITGLSFDGVGVLANIRKRVHFCFLSPEDAMTAVGPDEEDGDKAGEEAKATRFGGLLQEIKVESEIGERDGGKQSLKNVGKVERFVLEQVRRIFEEEFVYPSFWTFLV